MTLVKRGTLHGIGARAHARLASIRLRAGIGIVARRSIRLWRMAWRACITGFIGTGIAIIGRKIRIVRDIRHGAASIAHRLFTVAAHLRGHGRICRREHQAAHLVHTSAGLAGIIRAWTIARRIAAHTHAVPIANQGIAARAHPTIAALRLCWMRCHARRAQIACAGIVVIGHIRVVVLLGGGALSIAHRTLTITGKLRGQRRARGPKAHFTLA